MLQRTYAKLAQLRDLDIERRDGVDRANCALSESPGAASVRLVRERGHDLGHFLGNARSPDGGWTDVLRGDRES